MYSFTVDQLNLLLQDSSRAKLAVSIENGSLLYCTGDEPFEYDSDWYSPRAMEIEEVIHGEVGDNVSLEILDTDLEVRISNYSTPIGGSAVTWHLFLRTTGDWTLIATLDWVARECTWEEAFFKITISGSSGFRKRAGISMFSRLCDLKFGGTLCGYSGALKTCDGTFASCTTRGRTTQFRGFRWAPEAGLVLTINGVDHSYVTPPGENNTSFNPGIFQPPTKVASVRRPSGRIAPVGSAAADALSGGSAGHASGRRGY